MQSFNTSFNSNPLKLVVSGIKHKNKGVWPPYYAFGCFKDHINQCRHALRHCECLPSPSTRRTQWLNCHDVAKVWRPITCRSLSHLFMQRVPLQIESNFLAKGYIGTNHTQGLAHSVTSYDLFSRFRRMPCHIRTSYNSQSELLIKNT
jgi:hypothetical protein